MDGAARWGWMGGGEEQETCTWGPFTDLLRDFLQVKTLPAPPPVFPAPPVSSSSPVPPPPSPPHPGSETLKKDLRVLTDQPTAVSPS